MADPINRPLCPTCFQPTGRGANDPVPASGNCAGCEIALGALFMQFATQQGMQQQMLQQAAEMQRLMQLGQAQHQAQQQKEKEDRAAAVAQRNTENRRSRDAQRKVAEAEKNEAQKLKRREAAQRRKAKKSTDAIQKARETNADKQASADHAKLEDAPARSAGRAAEAIRESQVEERAEVIDQRNLAVLSELDLMTQPELAVARNETEFPAPISCERVSALSAAAAIALNTLDVVCAVCDCWTVMNKECCEQWPFSSFALEIVQKTPGRSSCTSSCK